MNGADGRGDAAGRSRSVLHALNDGMSQLVERVQQSVVQVHGSRRGGGTGFAVAPALIVTNAHVVRSRRVRVTSADGQVRRAQLAAHDAERDLAVLHVEGADLPPLRLADTTALGAGQWVLAVGHPWGVVGAATAGIILSQAASWGPQGEWFMTDLHLRPGHSGGPLVDTRGAVVGVATLVLGPDLGVAIPAHTVQAFLHAVEAGPCGLEYGG